jgi:hypothetical protein
MKSSKIECPPNLRVSRIDHLKSPVDGKAIDDVTCHASANSI